MTPFAAFMSGWGWVWCSIASAAVSAGIFLAAQHFRQRGDYLVLWSRIAVLALLAPFLSVVALPQDWRFYAAVGGTALIAALADVRSFDVATRYGAGVVTRVQPLTVWGSFLLWFAVDPGLLRNYAAHPFNTCGILLALGGCMWFANHQNKCRITRRAFKEMLPALLGYSVTTVFNKYAMDYGTLAGAALGYMFVQSLLAVPCLSLLMLWRQRRKKKKLPPWRTKKMLQAAAAVGALWVVSMAFKNYAMAFTPNPSYQAAVSLTSPLFVSLFYLATKHREEADVKAGMGVVACAMALALLTVR